MKTFVPAFVAAVLLAACFDDGGGSGESYYLSTGDYLTSGATFPTNTCQAPLDPADFNDQIFFVTTSDGIVSVDSDDFPRNGNAFGTTENLPGQQVTATCTLDLLSTYSGVIVANDAFQTTIRLDVSNPVGGGCGAVIPGPIPCSVQIRYRADLQ